MYIRFGYTVNLRGIHNLLSITHGWKVVEYLSITYVIKALKTAQIGTKLEEYSGYGKHSLYFYLFKQ